MNKKTLAIVAGVCGIAASTASTQAQAVSPNLVAWYKFDEAVGASTAANSVSGSTAGTISSGVTTGQAGISGNAYSFNNTSGFVDMGNANFFSSINTAQKVTISAWVRTSDTTGTRNVVVFAGNDAVSDRYMDIGYSGAGDPAALPTALSANKAYARDRASGNGINAVGNSATNIAAASSTWHQIVMTIDLSLTTNQLSLYVDGVIANTQTLSGASAAFPVLNNFEVGRLGRSVPTDYFGGLIDDVQVYNTALSAGDVTYMFNNPGFAAVPEPSVYAWAMAGLCGAFVFLRRRRATAS